jgi:hypothetical protein
MTALEDPRRTNKDESERVWTKPMLVTKVVKLVNQVQGVW